MHEKKKEKDEKEERKEERKEEQKEEDGDSPICVPCDPGNPVKFSDENSKNNNRNGKNASSTSGSTLILKTPAVWTCDKIMCTCALHLQKRAMENKMEKAKPTTSHRGRGGGGGDLLGMSLDHQEDEDLTGKMEKNPIIINPIAMIRAPPLSNQNRGGGFSAGGILSMDQGNQGRDGGENGDNGFVDDPGINLMLGGGAGGNGLQL